MIPGSGQIAFDPATMQLIGSGNSHIDSLIQAHRGISTKQLLFWQLGLAIRNVKNILSVCNASQKALTCVVYVNTSKFMETSSTDEYATNVVDEITEEVQYMMGRLPKDELASKSIAEWCDWFPSFIGRRSKSEISTLTSLSASTTARRWYEPPVADSARGQPGEAIDGQDSDGDSEELDDVEAKSVNRLPVLVVFVPNLPRQAIVEVEVESATQALPTHCISYHSLTGSFHSSSSCGHAAERISKPAQMNSDYLSWPLWNSRPQVHSPGDIEILLSTDTSHQWQFRDSTTGWQTTSRESGVCAISEATRCKRTFCKGFACVYNSDSRLYLSVSDVVTGLVQLAKLELQDADMSTSVDLKCVRCFYNVNVFSHLLLNSGDALHAMVSTTLESECIRQFGFMPNVSVFATSGPGGSRNEESVAVASVQFDAINLLQLDTEVWIWNGRQS
jgi:hypothetical protein